MSRAGWDPEQYAKFAAERAQPFWDLVGLVDASRPVATAVDLGCGDGGLTDSLAERLGLVEMVGVDSSSAMLERATARERPGLSFVRGDIGTWEEPGGFDLVVANASLHWVPDHAAVLARWAGSLRPGGQLAVQLPANADHPSHRAAVETGETEPFRSAMGGAPPPDPTDVNVLAPERYAELLYDLGFVERHVRLQVYGDVLDSTDAVVEWLRGSGLTRFFAVLPDELREPFVDRYRERVRAALGDRSPFLFTFKRILMWGRIG